MKHDIHQNKNVFRFYPILYRLSLSEFNFIKPLLSKFLDHNRNCDQFMNFRECCNRYVVVYITKYVC